MLRSSAIQLLDAQTLLHTALIFMMVFLQFLTLANLVALYTAGAANPSESSEYTDPSKWPEKFKFCGGLNQSPVDICTDDVIPNPTLGNIVYTNLKKKSAQPLTLINSDGEQAKLEGFDHTVTISEGGLPADQYRIEQLHFHVGSKNKRGSEHYINGKSFPAEMHVVFFSSDYDNYTAATNRPQGVAVLTVLFKISREDNDNYKPIVDKICDIKHPGDTTKVEPLAIRTLLPDDIKHWYRYRGSLTTPPCYQSVIWTIYKDLVKISEDQLDRFRHCLFTDYSLYGDTGGRVIDNFRPLQPLNGRLIEENRGACSPKHCNDDGGNENGDNGRLARYRGRKNRPRRCDGKSRENGDDNGCEDRPGCYDDWGNGNGKENGNGNGRENGNGNGRDNGNGNGRDNGNGNGNGREKGNGNGNGRGNGNGNGNGKDNGNGNGNGRGNGNGNGNGNGR